MGKKRYNLLIMTQKMFFLAKWSISGYLLKMHFRILMMSRSWSRSAIPYQSTLPSPG